MRHDQSVRPFQQGIVSPMKTRILLIAPAMAFAMILSTFPAGAIPAGAATLSSWAIGPFNRPSDQPAIRPNPDAVFDCPLSNTPVHWEKAWVYNPAALVKDGKIVVLYRAQQGPGNSCSRIGYAESEDGIHFKTDPTPVFFPSDDPQKPWEWSGSDRNGGCEDPRLAQSPDGSYILTYTQFNGGKYRLGIAASTDLKHWTKLGPAFAATPYADKAFKSASIVHEVKDGHLVAAKINGKYWMYFSIAGGKIATSDDLIHWSPLEDAKGKLRDFMPLRRGHFDSGLDEIGPVPVLTKAGIVVFFNGANNDPKKGGDPSLRAGVYCGGQALFDRNDPTHLIARLDQPYIKPELPLEQTGLYKAGTTFTEGLVLFKGSWFVYYGCADSFVGVAICDQGHHPAQQ